MLGYGATRGWVVMPCWVLACLAGFGFMATNQAQGALPAQDFPKRVLILYSYDREEGMFADFDRSLRAQLTAQSRDRVQFFTEYLDLVRFNSPEHARQAAELLEAKYSALKPDVVVPVSYAALKFVLGEGGARAPFSDVPVVALFNNRSADAIRLAVENRHRGGGVTAIATTDEPVRTLNLILKLQPATKKVAVIAGSSAREQAWVQELQGDFVSDRRGLEFLYFSGLSMEKLLEKVRALEPDTVILYTYFFEDGEGKFFLPEDALDLISHASSVPVYGIEDTYMGHRVIGGHMTDSGQLGVLAARSAARVLNGEKAADIPIIEDHSPRDMVDWRELQRWNISEKRIPPGTIELFREPTAWEKYRNLILAISALAIVETALVVALILNIRRRKRTESALLREKTLADAVIEGLPGIFLLRDQSGKNLRWNKNAERVARHPFGEVTQLENVAEYDREMARRLIDQIFASGNGSLEVDLMTAAGGIAPYYWAGVRVELEGKPCLAGIGIDLSARKQAESALRRSEAQLRSLVENAPYGIATTSVSEDKFLSANPAIVKMLGYSSEAEILSLKLSRDLYLEGESSGFRAQPTRADYFRDVEFTWKKRDGKPISVRASGQRLPGKEQSDVLEIIVEDVTTRRTLEEQLRHAQKMEALGQLAGSTAHDFNNLLAVIIGHSELLAETLRGEGPEGSRIQIIKNAGERAASLTAQLLAFSRRQVMQSRTLNLNALVHETNKMLAHLMGEDIEKRVELERNLGMIKADSGQIVQVVMNLAVNARDAMPNGGTLSIRTYSKDFPEATVIHDLPVPAGRYVVLSVSDTGIGMSPDTLSHIFEPFFTTKPVGKGTGLGLATVFGIVKQSGGFIVAESEIDKGTTFSTYFPQVDAAEEQVASPVSYVSARGSATVLLVEDEPAFRDLLVEGLESAGYRVLVGQNGIDAIRVAEQHSGPINLLLTDVIMPQMSGPDLARWLKPLHPELSILYMSGYTDDKLDAVASDEAVALLQKPFYIHDLLRKIQEILNRPLPLLRSTAASSGPSPIDGIPG